jgi:hypothetical protein
MRTLAALLLLLPCACSGGNTPGAQASGPAGLYEGGRADRPDRLCLTGGGADLRFGLIVWGEGDSNCTARGVASLAGGRLTLRTAGDETCTIETITKDGRLFLPQALPDGCAYYCGERARLAGAQFEFRKGGDEAAAKAKDLVGDPVCR